MRTPTAVTFTLLGLLLATASRGGEALAGRPAEAGTAMRTTVAGSRAAVPATVNCASSTDPCTFLGRVRLKQSGDNSGYELAGYANGQRFGVFSGSDLRSELILSARSGSLDDNRAVSMKYVPGATGAGQGKLEIGQLATSSNQAFTHGSTAFRTLGVERLLINAQGNVGLGTASPKGRLHIAGVDYGSAPVVLESVAPAAVGASLNLDATPGGGRQYALLSTGSQSSTGGGSFSVFDVAANQHRLTVNSAGNVTATSDLTVKGGDLRLESTCAPPSCPVAVTSALDLTAEGQLAAAGTDAFGSARTLTLSGGGGTVLQPSGGRVGVGTTSPVSELHVSGAGPFTQLTLETRDALGSAATRLRVGGNDEWDLGASGGSGGFYVADVQDGGPAYRVFIPRQGPARGRVGIGTTAPRAELDVAGTTRTQAIEITGGADLAEPFPVSGPARVEPGMVVAIDPATPGALRVADRPYDRTVAGVISGAGGVRPGVTMRQLDTTADGGMPVALSGRVYVQADAAYGAIQPGDLLTSSATSGHAMRVADHERAQGAILGKAMTRLDAGRGLVLVLVSLQ